MVSKCVQTAQGPAHPPLGAGYLLRVGAWYRRSHQLPRRMLTRSVRLVQLFPESSLVSAAE